MTARLKKRYVVNFPKHLSVCEFNYYRLMRLLPNRENTAQWRYLAGQGPGEMAIIINTTESAKYTTTVHIVVYSRLQKPMAWVKKHQGLDRVIPAQHDNQTSCSVKATNLAHNTKSYSLDVRAYHDATLAEVVAWQGQRRFQPRHEYPNPHMYQRDEKAQLNQFLGELLGFCLEKGRIMRDVLNTSSS